VASPGGEAASEQSFRTRFYARRDARRDVPEGCRVRHHCRTVSVAILVPMLGRAHHIAPLVESIRSTCPSASVLFGCSPGDRKVIGQLERMGEQFFTVPGPAPGDYARKINEGFRRTTEPVVFLAASDLRFHAGWWEAIEAKLTPGVGVVGTNDLGSPRVLAGEHSTHSAVTRDYVERFGLIDQPGVVLFEGYEHEYVDDELVQTAMHRGAWVFAEDSQVEHLHPSWGKAPTDRMYRQQRQRMRRSRALYQERRQLWT